MIGSIIPLDKPIKPYDWLIWKKGFHDKNPLRKTRISEDGMQIICASEDDRDKIIAYLLPEVTARFGAVV